jgi:TusA-related sulfurtransferase
MSAHRVDAGALELGGGLEVLVRAALESVAVGGELEVTTPSRAVAYELPAWARISGHEHVGEGIEERDGRRSFVVRIRRGAATGVLAGPLPPAGEPLPGQDGRLHFAALRAVEPVPATADPTGGLVPLGALAEAGGPAHTWRLNDRDRMWADELASLSERAARAQWDATRDIPWAEAVGLPAHVEQAVAQVMTYIAQNEYAALYVPARFLPQVNPQYAEVLLWLSSHVHDEARHVEVFTKRALAGGARAYALASTDLSLHSLLEESDFSAAALLLKCSARARSSTCFASSSVTRRTQRRPRRPGSRIGTSAVTCSSASRTSVGASRSAPTSGTPSSPPRSRGPRSSRASPD